MEGMLLKRSRRGRKQWNDRYFTLSGNVLSYTNSGCPPSNHHNHSLVATNNSTQDTPHTHPLLSHPQQHHALRRCSFSITTEHCSIGDLYMDQRPRTGGGGGGGGGSSDHNNKEVLYCFRVYFEDAAVQYDSTSLPPPSPGGATAATGNAAASTTDMSPLLPQYPKLSDGADTNNEHDDAAENLHPKRLHNPFKRPRAINTGNTIHQSNHDTNNNNNNNNSSIMNLKKKSAPPLTPDLGETTKSDDDNLGGAPSSSNSMVVRPKLTPKRRQLAPSLAGMEEDDHLFRSDPTLDDAHTNADATTPAMAARSSYFHERQLQEQQLIHTHYLVAQKQQKKKKRKKLVDGSKYAVAAGAAVLVGVLTAGVGLVAGLALLGAGAAAGGTGVVGGAAYHQIKKKRGEIVIASPNYEEARRWKAALDACLVSEAISESTWGQLFVMDGRSAKTALLPTEISTIRINGEQSDNEISPRKAFGFGHHDEHGSTPPTVVDPDANWQPVEDGFFTLLGSSGLRIFREERHSSHRSPLSVKESACHPLKAQTVLNASALEAFFCLMSLARVPSKSSSNKPKSDQRASFRVVERMDDNTDVIHLFFRPLYLFPSWTSPRDFCLFRYWRYDEDGSYVICLDSINHKGCPPNSDFTRGDMHGVYTIAPKKRTKHGNDDVAEECLLTCIMQVDPRGWVPQTLFSSYAESFGVVALLQMLDVKDALDRERFVPVPLDNATVSYSLRRLNLGKHQPDDMYENPINYDYQYSNREHHHSTTDGTSSSISLYPPPLPHHKWAQLDANSFLVRGKEYKANKVKVNAGSSIGRLIAVDVVRVDAPMYSGLSLHPTERIQLALERERRQLARGAPHDTPPFVFLINIMLPGPPYYHGAFYYAIDDMSCIDGSDGTPSSRLCQKFFFGNDDGFRDRTFKLIPTIVEGNFVVKKAVGSTPAIMGTKLTQHYVKNDRFFEVMLDCGSSSVATGVIRLSLGYAKTLVVDMGFLLEGDSEEYLPERIFGCVRMKYPEFGTHLRKVVPAHLLKKAVGEMHDAAITH